MYEKAVQDLQKINHIADEKQAKMNTMIDGVKKQVKQKEEESEQYKVYKTYLDRYSKKQEFEGSVQHRLKQSEFKQLESSIQQLDYDNKETIEKSKRYKE